MSRKLLFVVLKYVNDRFNTPFVLHLPPPFPMRTTSCFVSGVVTNNYAHRAIVHELVPQTRVAVSPVKMTLPSLLTSVQVFDGSNISDAIVYSNRFSETLSSKLTELILAQLLATLIFVMIAALVTAHGKFLLDVLDDDDNDNDSQITISKSRTTTKFRKADDPPPPVLDFTKLIFCICIDILGSSNEAMPLAGEFVDVIYAPIAALLLRQLFAGSNVVALLEFTEEILPFTDVLPLATICWVVESFYGSSNLARVLRIGRY